MSSKIYISFISNSIAKRFHHPMCIFSQPKYLVNGHNRQFNQLCLHKSSFIRLPCSPVATHQKLQNLFASYSTQNKLKNDVGSKKDELKVKEEVKEGDEPNVEETEKLSLFQRYKKMLKEYWYVLIPVHFVTSPVWFISFYYAAKSGLDIVPLLEYLNLPEKLIAPLRSSSLGYIAVASAFYKLATPARYMVTLGGTTFSVKYLTKRGLIKPVPSKAKIKSIIQNKLKKDGET